MGLLKLRHKAAIASGTATPAQLYETIRDLEDGLNTIALHTAVSVVGSQVAPPRPVALSVKAANGIFDVQITDNHPSTADLTPEYFVEYATDSGFSAPIVKHLGPSRNWRTSLGNQTLFWRVYSQYGRSSPTSDHVYVTGNIAVVGGGSAGPTIQTSAGSGTNPTSGLGGGVGYGRIPVRQRQ